MNIVCIKDSTERRMEFFEIRNEQWPFERMQKEYIKLHPEIVSPYGGDGDWRGHFESFVKFMEQHNAQKIHIPTLDAPAFPDPDYGD